MVFAMISKSKIEKNANGFQHELYRVGVLRHVSYVALVLSVTNMACVLGATSASVNLDTQRFQPDIACSKLTIERSNKTS